MPAPTVPVTVDLASQGGPALAGITVRARLDLNEIHQGFVISDPVEAVTDANGVAVLDLFPNAPSPAGLGTQGSTYSIRATIPGRYSLNVSARVPNQACRLENILVSSEAVPLNAAQLAVLQAQQSAGQAGASADSASADADRAEESRQQAEEAAAKVPVSGTDAWLRLHAANLDALITGAITRDANGAATSAAVVWPDGTPGTYSATSVSTAFPGAVDAYTVTYGSPAARTVTQPAVTRDASGAVTNRPAMTVA